MKNLQAIDEILEGIVLEDIDLDTACGEVLSLPLLETVRRVRVRMGGINVTQRKSGRPDPRRSMLAKMQARRNAPRRKQAMQRYQRSPKARMVRQFMSRRRLRRR